MVAHARANTMRDLSADEIRGRVAELREELFNLRFRNSMKQLDNPVKIRSNRREMARLLTVLREKEGTAAPTA
ncbi:MAG: 50S ribosomal protein L29 [Candidatus Eisenbacteria bacterium]|nr:50S ribosomal protein L29 [Candidatus Eisenbacteria bacterium]